MERIPQLHGLPGPEDGLLAGERPLRAHPHPDQHFGHAVAGVEIVIHHQSLQAFQLRDPLRTVVLRLDAQRHTDDKLGALARLCPDLDGAAHHIHDVLGDGHAQAGALDPAHGGASLPLKGIEDLFRKFRAHADAVVLDPDLILLPVLPGPRKLSEPDGDRSACRGELDGVGQQIQQHLIQPRLVAIDILIGDVHCVHIKLQLLCVDLPADDGL